eukprot:2220830-Rhodomonas_salina.2
MPPERRVSDERFASSSLENTAGIVMLVSLHPKNVKMLECTQYAQVPRFKHCGQDLQGTHTLSRKDRNNGLRTPL